MKRILSILCLAVISGVAFGAYFSPVIYFDDWPEMIQRYYNHSLGWVVPTISRPLSQAFYKLLFTIFGLNISALYLVKIALLCIAAVQIYFLAKAILNRGWLVPFVFASIYLIYPADFTRMWLDMISPGWVITLLYAWLLYKYLQTGRVWFLILALICFIVPLFEYEGQLGLAAAFAGLCFMLSKKPIKEPRRWLLLTPVLLAGLFVLYKVGLQPVFLNVIERRVGRTSLAPGDLIPRAIEGGLILFRGWIYPIYSLNGSKRLSAGLLILAAVLCSGIVSLATRWTHAGTVFTWAEKRHELRHLSVIGLAGVGFTLAGFLPAITFIAPLLAGVSTRYDIFAIPGAALVLLALIWGWAVILAHHPGQTQWILLAASLPFIFIGVFSQVLVQREAQSNWQEQKILWSHFFQAIPDLTPDTHLVMIISNNTRHKPRYAERDLYETSPYNQEFSAALNVFYGDPSLGVDFQFPQYPSKYQPVLVELGAKIYKGNQFYPYSQLLLVTYDRATQQLKIVKDIHAEMKVNWYAPEYQPVHHIRSSPPSPRHTWRFLVSP